MYGAHYVCEGESRDTYLPGSSSRQQWVPRPNSRRLYLDEALVILASKGMAITPADLRTSLDGLLKAKADLKPIDRCAKLQHLNLKLGGQSDRSACMTSTRAARAAGTADAMTAAASSTNAETITGRTLGMRTSRN